MKKVISEKETKEKIEEAINLICGTVKKTLGPLGSDMLIDNSNMMPYITNDGVTIAENIESEDIIINTILTIIKSSAIKTNEIVGDGTTTTLVLLEKIYKSGLKEIEKGQNPFILKKLIEDSLKKIIKLIKKEKIKITKDIIKDIATVSSNDEQIGNIISNIFYKYSQIEIKEGKKEIDTIDEVTGYYFENLLVSPYFLEVKQKLKLEDAYVLIKTNSVTDLEQIENIINHIIINNKPLLIIAKDFSEYVVNQVLSFNHENMTNIYLTTLPEYGNNQLKVIKDIEELTSANIEKSDKKSETNNLGTAKNIIIDEEKIIITSNISMSPYIKEIEREYSNLNNEFDREFAKNRLNKLKNGTGIINVGGLTNLEIKEKKMRYDDALSSVKSLKNGALIGGGLTLYKIGEKLDIETKGDEIMKEVLSTPIKQLINNIGLESGEILKEIKEKKYTILYNTKKNKLENIQTTKILDSYNVVIESLKNAVSIANLLLNISNVVINETNIKKTIVEEI